ncbi:MAG: hypothetical protein H6920_07185 [Sphingomonadaceae bacterium]|nr:hypothetical protein [Altererythrobacter sp.]MCP5391388.1 hypothetical protein [Sphingomonadaceae bacterium]MCP5393617.1 hypothetical protein [Sphingomonadaceae bacterium]
MKLRLCRILLVSAPLTMLPLTSTLAQEQPSTAAETNYLESLKACQNITSDAERLECYDEAVGRVVTASDEGEVRLVDRDDVEKTRRGLFGFTLPKLRLFGDGEEGEMDLLESKVTRVISVRGDTVVFEIEEGSVWRMTDAPARVIRRLEVGAPVVFKKAALGTYFIRVDGLTGIKGKRIE